jgi:hypothetical protein
LGAFASFLCEAAVNFHDPLVARLAAFVAGIGLEVEPASLSESFLPGLGIRHGKLLIDESRLAWPGDVLHEAGHLALVPAAERACIEDDAGADAGFEMAAIAWSYAAALHLGIDPAIVFHSAGYKGWSPAILDNFSHGRYVGVPILVWLGMTVDPRKPGRTDAPPYPHMLQWLRG